VVLAYFRVLSFESDRRQTAIGERPPYEAWRSLRQIHSVARLDFPPTWFLRTSEFCLSRPKKLLWLASSPFALLFASLRVFSLERGCHNKIETTILSCTSTPPRRIDLKLTVFRLMIHVNRRSLLKDTSLRAF